MFPCGEFCPEDFAIQSKKIISNYNKISLNDYKNSYHTEDVLMNNAVLYKFGLPNTFYYIEYLQIKDSITMPEKFKGFPVWIIDDKVLYDNKSMSYTKQGNIFVFKDTINQNILEFRIGKNSFDEVIDFYTAGGSNIINGKTYRESGVIDKNNIRIIVDKTDPELEIETNYGSLIQCYLKWKRKTVVQLKSF